MRCIKELNTSIAIAHCTFARQFLSSSFSSQSSNYQWLLEFKFHMDFPWALAKVFLSRCLLMLSVCLCCLLQAGPQLLSALTWPAGTLLVASLPYWVLHSPFQELLHAEHIHRPAVYKGASSLPFKSSAYPEGKCQKNISEQHFCCLSRGVFSLDSRIVSVSFLIYMTGQNNSFQFWFKDFSSLFIYASPRALQLNWLASFSFKFALL